MRRLLVTTNARMEGADSLQKNDHRQCKDNGDNGTGDTFVKNDNIGATESYLTLVVTHTHNPKVFVTSHDWDLINYSWD